MYLVNISFHTQSSRAGYLKLCMPPIRKPGKGTQFVIVKQKICSIPIKSYGYGEINSVLIQNSDN
jgi:hypothetical protein